VSERLTAAASQANLSPKEKEEVDGLSKLLDTHRNLLNLPQDVATRRFGELPTEQQNSLINTFGAEKDAPKRGWLSNAWHYSGYQAYKGLIEISDGMTRMYRFTRTSKELDDAGKDIENIEKFGLVGGVKKTISDAWKASGDKGEYVYDPVRLEKAEKKYGPVYIGVAKKMSEGQTLDDIVITGSELEKQIAAASSQNRDPLLEEALKDVRASKYSPGRQLANALLPEFMEGGGLLYNGISGTADAAYRIWADPTIILGKAKKGVDAARYGLTKIVGNTEKVNQVFQKPQVVNFFNTYGKELDNLAIARKARNPKAAADASAKLRRFAPEFGPAAIDEFVKAGVKNADTAQKYLANNVDMLAILKGQAARAVPLIPRLTPGRKARIAFFTATDNVFNIDKVGRKIVSALYGTAPGYDDILTGVTGRQVDIADIEKGIGRVKGPDGVVRFTENQIQGRIDRFARKFTKIPFFKNGLFDPLAPDATEQVYRVARLANSRYHSRLITETFQAGNENQRRQIMRGLWLTVATVRGVTKSLEGKTWYDEFAAGGPNKLYAPQIVVKGKNYGSPAEFNGQQLAIAPWQLSTAMAMPSVVELDRLVARSGLVSRVVGLSHKRIADKITSMWVFGTLAGPRFAVRNALEDTMAFLAIGSSPLGYFGGRSFSTKFRAAKTGFTAKGVGQQVKETLTIQTEPFELGAINKFLRRKEQKEFAEKYAKAQTYDEVRALLGSAFLRSGVGKALNPRTAGYLDELARLGSLDNTLLAVSEGAKNALRGFDQYYSAIDDAAKYGKLGPLQVDGIKYRQTHGKEAFSQINPVADQRSRVSWLVRIGVTTRDEMERIAVANLDNPTKAIDELKKYLDNLSPQDKARFELYTASAGGDVNIHAKRLYDSVRLIYSNSEGEINKRLLNKVRKKDKNGNFVVNSIDLKLDDLPGVGATQDAPAYISGPTLIPISEADNFAGTFTERGWNAMGEANARFSREPVVLYEFGRIRADLDDSGFAQRVMDQFTAGKTGDELLKAQDNAIRHVVELAEDMAQERVLAFVDNPAVRTQLAMSGRNFARFYRATEDFARRLYRIVRYNPESITRTALTIDGLSHSGFIMKDDRGEDYFVYPGMTPIYSAVNKVVNAFQMQEAFQAPMPVEFTGKVKMLTPSMNPDSLFPTFAGPVASLPLTAIFRLFPQFDALERALIGTYGEDQPMINAVIPSHVLRLMASLNQDERKGQFGSAARKAMTYLEATGNGLKPKFNEGTQEWEPFSEGELLEYQNKVRATATSILVLRFVFGFVAPASPQMSLKSEMAQWVKDNDRMNFKQVFSAMVNKYGNYEDAMKEWIRLFPDQMPYTVSESETRTNAIVKAVDGATEWIEKNSSTLKKYPEGAAFFIPREGNFDFSAYKMLYTMGIKRSKALEEFLQDVNTARDIQFYYNQKDLYEDELAATFSPYAKKNLNDQWELWSRQFKGSNPLLQKELGEGSQSALKRMAALADLRKLVDDKTVKVDKESKEVFKQMINVYDNYINTRDSVYGSGSSANNYKDMLKVNTKAELEKLSQTNANTADAYTVLFSRLIRD
jgi:hypothetical protein